MAAEDCRWMQQMMVQLSQRNCALLVRVYTTVCVLQGYDGEQQYAPALAAT
jgi:hypothetical protein